MQIKETDINETNEQQNQRDSDNLNESSLDFNYLNK